jgi:phosphoglycerate dehydrogenase-like enzyme
METSPLSFKFVMLPPQTDQFHRWGSSIKQALPDAEIVVAESEQEAAAAIVDADAAFGEIPPAILSKAKQLRWVQCHRSAPDAGYFHEALVAHPTVVTNMRGTYIEQLSAHAMALILALARNFQRYIPQQVHRNWDPGPDDQGVVQLPEATLLIVGMGGVGVEVARLAAAFGMTVIGTESRHSDKTAGVSELHPAEMLDALLPRADFVLMTIPHTPTTEGLMDRAKFQRMKRDAYFINIGRGMTTRLNDLVDALEAGEIAGAGIDVYDQEPLPASHPLWRQPNVLLTPHVASYGLYGDERRLKIVLDNCRAFIAGKPLHNIVDKANWH